MAASDKNNRRADEAERARHIAASEAVAFATVLLGLLNGAEAAQHRSEHEPDPLATEPVTPPPHPTEPAPTELAPADHGPSHEDRHASAIEAPAADSPPTIHADAAATIQAQDTSATIDAAPAGEAPATHVLTPPASSFSAPADHAHAAGGDTGPGGTTALSSLDLGTSVQQLADTVTGLVDTSLATVSHTIASLSATVGQLTSSLSGTISNLTDGLTGAVTDLTHDAPPVAGVLEPLVTDILGPTSNATDVSDTAQHGASSLLDTAGAVPTALLHPPPLQLGFLGQPTIDGHEAHDGAFSALGVHHF